MKQPTPVSDARYKILMKRRKTASVPEMLNPSFFLKYAFFFKIKIEIRYI